MQIYPINFRVYQIFLGYLIRIVFIILFDQIKNEIQFLFDEFYNQSEIFDRTPDNSINSIQLKNCQTFNNWIIKMLSDFI